MLLTYPSILAVLSVLTWWLSGYDSQVTGEDVRADFKRRATRCAVTIFLVGLGIAAAWGGGRFGGFVFIAIVVPVAIMWTGCLSEVFARGFHSLTDSQDSREFDPKELPRELDQLAASVREGRNEEAIDRCARLMNSSEGSASALEATLFRVYDEMFRKHRLCTSAPLAEVYRLCEQGNCITAELRLTQLLRREPVNLGAGMMLMQLYAGNLGSRNRAGAVLQQLAHRREVPPGFVDYARERIDAALPLGSEPEKSTEGVESLLVDQKQVKAPELEKAPEVEFDPKAASIDQLLASGYLGTAIEELEKCLRYRSHDFDLWLKLAEAHGFYCCNLNRAGEIVAKIEANTAFNAKQINTAKTKLQEWQKRAKEQSVI